MLSIQTDPISDYENSFFGGSFNIPWQGGTINISGGTGAGGGEVSTGSGGVQGGTGNWIGGSTSTLGGISLGMILIVLLALALIFKT